jgi:hypothetical protein
MNQFEKRIAMSQLISMNKSRIFGAATAFSALGLIFAPAIALAAPPLPLAPPCSQWGFAGDTRFDQSNGWAMRFTSTGAQANGPAVGFTPKPPTQPSMHGTISGGVDGYAIKLEVRWDGGALGKYEGSVDANGFAHGTSYDAKTPSSTATWTTEGPLKCIAAPAPPQPAPAPQQPAPAPQQPAPAAQKTATATDDVDLYDAAGGDGNVTGTLRKGDVVGLFSACEPSDWCKVQSPRLGNGWVWGHLQF